MHRGERRIRVDGQVCPMLRNGLNTAMLQLQHWYGETHHSLVTIEATKGAVPPMPNSRQRTALLMSGGVDALTSLRCNRLDFPLEHPGSVRDCFFFHGFDIGGSQALDKQIETNSKLTIASLSRLAESADLTFIPVYSNLRHLGENDRLSTFESFGAELAAIPHAFSRRVTTALIASSFAIPDLHPLGSHPLLDPNYSSASLSIQHDGLRLSRLEKVGLIADWDLALQTLQPCANIFRPSNKLNCGKCDKCIRTMTELLVLGKLAQCTTFEFDDVSPVLLQTLKAVVPDDLTNEREEFLKISYVMFQAYFWRELVEPLEQAGRNDLVAVIKTKLSEYERHQVNLKRGRWKRVVRQFDRRFLGSSLKKLKRNSRNWLGSGARS